MSDQQSSNGKSDGDAQIIMFIKSWLPIIVRRGLGGLSYWTARADTERNAGVTRRIEAQKPFLEQELKLTWRLLRSVARL